MLNGISAKQFIKDLLKETKEDNVFNGAAALAYYLTLAIFPALILLMTVIPYLPIQNVDQALMDMLGQALPQEAYAMVDKVITEVTSNRKGGLLSFGLLGTIWAASTGMYAIMQQLNITYDVKEARNFFKARGTALILSFLFGLLILGAFSMIVLGGVIEDWLRDRFGFGGAILMIFAVLRWVIIILAMLLGFAMIYKWAPNVEQEFKFITPGSVLGVLLLAVASLAFGFYVSNFGNYDATYGSLGAIIILMFWLYIAGLVILIGSEINALVEHYSPDGKQKGQKQEGGGAGEPLAT